MTEDLARLLARSLPDCSPREIAELLLILGSSTQSVGAASDAGAWPHPVQRVTRGEWASTTSRERAKLPREGRKQPEEPTADGSSSTERERSDEDASPRLLRLEALTGGGDGLRSTRVTLSGPSALGQPLNIARALAPLRRITGPGVRELDVDGTVDATADAGHLVVVTKARREPILDVAVVVDCSLSMGVWTEVAREFDALLRRLGVFRSGSYWSLVIDEESGGGPCRIYLRDASGAAHRTEDLIDPLGRRLIIVVTDGIAEAWYRDAIWTVLAAWGRSCVTAILDVLPAAYWPETGIGAPGVAMRSPWPAAPNSLSELSWAWWAEPDNRATENPPVPIVSFRSDSMLQWSSAISTASAWADAVTVFRERGESARDHNASIGARDRVASFRRRASRDAQDLAVALAGVPVLSFEVMRVVQSELLPHTQTVELAEVVVGGLFEQVPGARGLPLFRFRAGVQAELLRGVPASRQWDTFEVISRYLERKGSGAGAIHALLSDPQGEVWAEASSQPFGRLGLAALASLGIHGGDRAPLVEGGAVGESPAAELRDEWDIVLAYVAADRLWTDWIASTLEGAGYRTARLEADETRLQEAWDLDERVRAAAGLSIVIVSDNLLNARGYLDREVTRLFERGKRARPATWIRIDNCALPGVMATIVGIELADRTEEAARATLLDRVGSVLGPRSEAADVSAGPHLPLPPEPVWDFFVSYAQADRTWAEWIAWQLEDDGHRVLVQAWDFFPGMNWIQSMQEGVSRSTRTIAVLSETYLNSVYSAAEWQAAWAADPTGHDRKLLTVRVANCERPGLLVDVPGVDLFGKPEAQAREALRAMIRRAPAGRAKPTWPPQFHGRPRAADRQARFPGALPQVWNVPARNPKFTGRGAELSFLAKELAAGSRAAIHSIRGMGGVGKTQLATEYAHAYADRYDLVWWVAAEEPALIPDQFIHLGTELGLDLLAADVEDVATRVHRALQHVPGWLLIFDQVDEVRDIQAWLPSAPFPTGVPGHVIITTRRHAFEGFGPVLSLDVLTVDEGVRMLRDRLPTIADHDAVNIARELGGLPLALEQAASYLHMTKMPASGYVELLRTRGEELYQRGGVHGRNDTIATLWALNLAVLTDKAPAAVQLLDLCAYLAPVSIPLDLFTDNHILLPEPLAASVADALEFNDVLTVVADYSLATRTSNGLIVHPLVQGAIRGRHQQWDESANETLAVTLALLRSNAPESIEGVPESWPRWELLLPHVIAATGHYRDTLNHTDSASTNCSWLLRTAGKYLRLHGRLEEGRPLLERALAMDEAVLGPDHPDVARDLNNLGLALRDMGDLAGSRPLIERALRIDEASYGPESPYVAASLDNLGVVLWELGDPSASQRLLERALAISEAEHGPDHPDVAARLNNLALVLLALGEPAMARSLLERALVIDERVYGPDHPDVASRLSNLGMALEALGDLESARPLMERALMIHEAAYGPDHPQLALRLKRLGSLMEELGESDAAAPLLNRARAIEEGAISA